MQMLSILPLDKHLVSRRDQGLAEGLVWQRTSLSSVCVFWRWLTNLLDSPVPTTTCGARPGVFRPLILWPAEPCTNHLPSLHQLYLAFKVQTPFLLLFLTHRPHLCNSDNNLTAVSLLGSAVPSTVVRVSTITFNCKPEMFSDCKRSGHSRLLGVELEL